MAASMSSTSNPMCDTIRLSASSSTTENSSAVTSPGPRPRFKPQIRLRARRAPRVAMTVGVMTSSGRTSAMPRMSAMWSPRPRRIPPFTTRRRSSEKMSSAISSAIAAHSRAAKCFQKRSPTWACRVLQSRRLRLQFVEARERGVEVCLVEDLEPGDHVAFKCEKGDLAPFESEALL